MHRFVSTLATKGLSNVDEMGAWNEFRESPHVYDGDALKAIHSAKTHIRAFLSAH